MEERKRKNPWLGLASYREGEVLYGRDDDIRDLTQSVVNDTDTLLYGKSGIGKSSILNAGVIPAARRYGYLPVLVRLSHKERHSYLLQIKNAIANAMIPVPLNESGSQVELTAEESSQRDIALKSRIREAVACRDEAKESLYEYFHRHTFHDKAGERIKLLVIFDQFEEIFTLQPDESKKKRFFGELADFLNDVMPSELQTEAKPEDAGKEAATVVEGADFEDLFKDIDLGGKSDLPQYVTDNEIHLVFTIREDFLSEFEYYSASIPSLKQNRYGLRPINEEQASQIILRPMPGVIDKSVAKLIIEKVTGRSDFELDGVPEIEVDSAVLSLYLNRLYEAKTGDRITTELVEEKGGEIIADFYDDAISGISEDTIEYLEDMLLNGQGRRDNITIFDAIHDGGATEEELDILCNRKKILRQFNYAGDLRIEYVHDILCPVIKAHKDERLFLKQQEEERRRQEEEKQRILEEEKAKREKIRKEAQEERERMKAEAMLARQRNRRRFIAVGTFLLVLALGATFIWFWFIQEYKASYAAFTTKDGWPVGIGKVLDDDDKKSMPVYYQLVRNGYRSHNTRVNVLNSHKETTRNNFNESPLVGLYETEGADAKARDFAILQRQTAYWVFTPDNDWNLLRKTAYDPDGKELYAIQYFRSTAISADENAASSLKKQLWANYVDRDGKVMRVRDNGADRVRIIVNDSTGFYEGYHFYSESGTPQTNHVGVYGYRFQLGPDGRILKKTPVDAFGDLQEEAEIVYEDFDEYGRWTGMAGGKAEYSNQLVVFSLKNRTDSLKFGSRGELLCHSETKTDGEARVFHYEKGMVVKTYRYQNNRLCYSREVIPSSDKNVRTTRVFWADSTLQYRIKREEYSPSKQTVSYFAGTSPTTVNQPMTVKTSEGAYHKSVSDTTSENGMVKVTKEYYNENETLSQQRDYNQEIAYYNSNNELVKRIVQKDGKRIFAYINEYEDGQITAQSVLGIDNEAPIRYAGWEKNQMCYYKMKLVYNFSNTLVAVKGVNEFGEESLITTSDLENYTAQILPSSEMETTIREGAEISYIYGIQVYKVQYPTVNKDHKAEYIHINNMEGSWYQAGIRDGDLLVEESDSIVIARPDVEQNTYRILRIHVESGQTGAEHYPVYFTDKEIERYNNALNSKK